MSIETNVSLTVVQAFAKNAIFRILLALCATFIVACTSAPPKQVEIKTGPVASSEPSAINELDRGLYQKALDLLASNDTRASLKILRKLDRKYANNPGIKVNLATAFFQVGDIAAAKKIATQVSDIDSKLPQAHNLLGLIYLEEKNFKDAEAAYSAALKLDKNYATAHYNIALLYDIYYQDIAKAYEHYTKYLALVGEDQETKDWIEQLKYSLERES